MNPYFVIILCAIIGEYVLRTTARFLNVQAISPKIPNGFEEFYDKDKYAKSQKYLKTNTQFALIRSTFDLIVILLVILGGYFEVFDQFVRSFGYSSVISGLIFFGFIFIIQDILSLPFSLYAIFSIEEKFGFNKTTPKTFIMDKVKSYIITIVLGGIVMGGILIFFENSGVFGWLYAWGLVSLFIVLGPILFTSIIAPIFNKFTPLEDGELLDVITQYSKKVDFPLTKIDVMDGSKRSSHSNAYFSGFGKKKRIALYDTLIEKHTVNELLAVIAHEVGHYKKKHIIKRTITGILQTGVMFFLISIFMKNVQLFEAFQVSQMSVYAGILFFGILYSPVDLVLSIISNFFSRKHEFEADAFASETTGSSEYMINGLKRISAENLGNLTPHSLTVILNYDHPPMIERIRVLGKE
jgi:STE24 endopeptidase